MGSSPADMTPPVAITLIQSAPYLTCSRIMARISSTPLTVRVGVWIAASGASVLRSLCPPVGPSACGATKMRGPGCSPAAIERLTETIA